MGMLPGGSSSGVHVAPPSVVRTSVAPWYSATQPVVALTKDIAPHQIPGAGGIVSRTVHVSPPSDVESTSPLSMAHPLEGSTNWISPRFASTLDHVAPPSCVRNS